MAGDEVLRTLLEPREKTVLNKKAIVFRIENTPTISVFVEMNDEYLIGFLGQRASRRRGAASMLPLSSYPSLRSGVIYPSSALTLNA